MTTTATSKRLPPPVCALAAALVLAGCGSSGHGDAPADAAPDAAAMCAAIGTTTGQFTFGPAVCDTCMSTSCCAPVTACLSGDTSGARPCADLLTCISACVVAGGTQQDCVVSCAMQHPAGVGAGLTLQNCMQASCATSCPSS